MPVYVCQPGTGDAEPWKHNIQVFAAPFPIDSAASSAAGAGGTAGSGDTSHLSPSRMGGGRDLIVANWSHPNAPTLESAAAYDAIRRQQQQQQQQTAGGGGGAAPVNSSSSATAATSSYQHPIRRIRHSEIVLVDDICVAYGRYWLRLRWPGHKGGFAGYIAMGLVKKKPKVEITLPADSDSSSPRGGNLLRIGGTTSSLDDDGGRVIEEATEDADDPARDEEPVEGGSMPPSDVEDDDDDESSLSGAGATMTCLRTGLSFQSSPVMKLLLGYDDGFSPQVSLVPFPTEHVLCRICREGLHDDADEEQPSPAADNDDGDGGGGGGDAAGAAVRDGSNHPSSTGGTTNNEDDDDDDDDDLPSSDPNILSNINDKGPVQPHPAYTVNPHALENPLLAPCECSGTMMFVHYLCVEQWRCRSRHPDAMSGRHCETCKRPYALPPPTERVRHQDAAAAAAADQDDWLDAMPPHVMQALRQPHFWWQIGAAIVRRRWLRPVAPVVMSPVVALYCRARRLLKKRGVARRRWACSLCRRRARWKCVRCLRSYYCSRQCQNVSWHIVHKHVCYKPVRFWWSVAVYGAATLAVFPGIVRDPLMYDLGFCLIPVSFIVTGILGGGIATLLKKAGGVDLRGRCLELSVVVFTLWLTVVTWGLVRGFFGNPAACHGVFGRCTIAEEDLQQGGNGGGGFGGVLFKFIRAFLLQPVQAYYLMWDRLALNSVSWLRAALCTTAGSSSTAAADNNHTDATATTTADAAELTTEGCFEHLPHANANFFLQENGGERCASDLLLVLWLYAASGFAYCAAAYWKHLERERRRHGRRPGQRGGGGAGGGGGGAGGGGGGAGAAMAAAALVNRPPPIPQRRDQQPPPQQQQPHLHQD